MASLASLSKTAVLFASTLIVSFGTVEAAPSPRSIGSDLSILLHNDLYGVWRKSTVDGLEWLNIPTE